MFLVAFAVFSLLSCGGRACELSGQPMDVVAEIRADAVLTCPTDIGRVNCDEDCKVKWYRLMSNKYKPISSCTLVYKNLTSKFSISDGPNWNLTIKNVMLADRRKYMCRISSSGASSTTVDSENVTIIVPSAINITVKANSAQITAGESALLTCDTSRARGVRLTYKWNLEGSSVSSFYNEPDQVVFGEYRRTLEIKNTHTGQSGAKVTCAAYSGATLVKTSDNYVLQIQDRPLTIQPIIPIKSTINPDPVTTIRDSVVPGTTTEDDDDSQPRSPDNQTKQERDTGFDHTESGSTALFAGGGVGAVFLILLIICLIYFLVFKGRNKKRSQSPNPRDGGRKYAGAVELAETQPTTPAAAVSAKASMSTTREGVAVEPHPVDSQTQVTVQDTVPLSVVDSTPFDCGYKPRHLDPVYALVDKSQHHTVAEQSTKVSGKDEPKSGATPAKDAGRDGVQSVQRDTNPGVKIATGSESSGKKPPSVIPYHLSKARKSTKKTEDKSEPPEQTADRGGDRAAHGDPRLKNAEGLIYADLDLSRGSPKIVNSEEEETLYAGIVNKEAVGNLREGSIRHAP